jgi:hypothetical protein
MKVNLPNSTTSLLKKKFSGREKILFGFVQCAMQNETASWVTE